MADTKLSALPELAATPAVGDEVYIRDISEAAADESKRITTANLLASRAQVATGTYTGDGETSQTITGVGFRPIYVLITRRLTAQAGVEIHYTTDIIVDDIAAGASVEDIGAATTVVDNAIISLDADGFKIDDDGADTDPNKDTETYNYLAIG